MNAAYRKAHPDKVTSLQANIAKEIRTHDVFGGAQPSRSFASDQFMPDTNEKFAAGGILVAPPMRQSVSVVSIPSLQRR
jgi:hypothetical protein